MNDNHFLVSRGSNQLIQEDENQGDLSNLSSVCQSKLDGHIDD
jgi:hypothetical protein